MRHLIIPALFSAGLLAAPAMAQTGSNSSGNSNQPASAMQVQQDLKQDLTKAGYTDVNIMPGSFLVMAKDSKGNPVQMVVSPHSVTAITALQASDQSGSSQSATKK